MPSLHLSRYAFPFTKDGKHLLYSSKNNSFYGINAELKDFLDNLRHGTVEEESISKDEILDSLHKAFSWVIMTMMISSIPSKQTTISWPTAMNG